MELVRALWIAMWRDSLTFGGNRGQTTIFRLSDPENEACPGLGTAAPTGRSRPALSPGRRQGDLEQVVRPLSCAFGARIACATGALSLLRANRHRAVPGQSAERKNWTVGRSSLAALPALAGTKLSREGLCRLSAGRRPGTTAPLGFFLALFKYCATTFAAGDGIARPNPLASRRRSVLSWAQCR